MITITDRVGTSGTVTVDKDDAAKAIRPWYTEPTAEVTEAIDALQTALTRHEDTGGWEEFLGIEIERSN
jgi:hypothetical protein